MIIRSILDNILSGKELQFEEAMVLLDASRDELPFLMHTADTIRKRFCGERIDLCYLINAKSGLCSEDCKFCAQSSRYETDCKVYPFVDSQKIIEEAHKAKKSGANHFCIVTSGEGPTENEFIKIKEAITRINKELDIEIDCSLGMVEKTWISELKSLGVKRYNHNLETSCEFYKSICTTHSYHDRLDMVKTLLDEGLDPCCGGIIGLGEDKIQRLKLAFSLKELKIRCVPINILNPIKGTPLAGIERLDSWEIIKTIAVFRLVLPEAIIKVAGGREYALGDFQAEAFRAGANGMIIGGYLTTKGRSVEEDLQMVRDLGFKF